MIRLILLLTGICWNARATPVNVEIIGGHDADIAQHPWQVSIFDRTEVFCGGALVSSEYVLTAAHCVSEKGKHFHIRAGTNSSHSGGVIVGVSEIILCPDFANNDLALIKLENKISGKFIKPIKLPQAYQPVAENSSINIAGWGKMDKIEPIKPKNLLETDIPIVNHEICANIYVHMIQPLYVTTKMFCGGIMETGGKGPCYGDSGGPAVANGEVIGLVSWGFKCADGNYPAVFVQVSYYTNWILKYIST